MASGRHDIAAFVERVLAEGRARYRDFPWRETSDPYAVLVSEVMLQQTQVSRVVRYYEAWLESFPTLEALASAPLEVVLRHWQGLGYNRRAVALKRLAEQVVEAHRASGAQGPATLPDDEVALRALPGVGPATAAGVLAFGFSRPAAYLETNVRTVFLHELFADADAVRDREIVPLVAEAAERARGIGVDSRTWNYALLDYGAHLKRTMPNPSRRSAHHTRQSTFEGSRRQKRARLLRLVMEAPGRSGDEYARDLAALEQSDGRVAPTPGEIIALLEELATEGFLSGGADRWTVRG